MEVKELRIGNHIKYKGKIFTVGMSDFLFIENDMNKSFFKEIKLTEEWLLTFSFRKLWHLNEYILVLFVDESLSFEYSMQYNILKIVLSEENNDLNIDVGKFVIYRNTNIKYVHQLQNLYFDLTGEELTLKQ